MAGVAVMVDPFGASFTARGPAAGLLTALTAAVLIVILKRARDVSPAAILAGALVVGCVLSVAADPRALGDALTDPDAAPYCVIMGACAVLSAALTATGIEAATAVSAAMLLSLEPVLVSLLAYAILGESLSAAQIAGGAVVIAAVTLVVHAPRRATLPP
jgi:drug/metabolite transporter (DMT)-like permease